MPGKDPIWARHIPTALHRFKIREDFLSYDVLNNRMRLELL